MVESDIKKEVSKGNPIEIPTNPKAIFPVSKTNKSTYTKKTLPNPKSNKPFVKKPFTGSKDNKPTFGKKPFKDSKDNKPKFVKKPFKDSKDFKSTNANIFFPDSENNKLTSGKRPFPDSQNNKPTAKRPFTNSKNNKTDRDFKKPKQFNDPKNSKSEQSIQNAKKPKSSLLSRLNSDSKDKSTTSQGNLKKKLRDAIRSLKKNTFDAETRQNTERRVKALELKIIEANKNKKDNAIAKKYRKVRLIESNKAARVIKKTENLLKEARESTDNKEEIAKLEEQLLNAQIDFNYTKHFPLNEKYISLFVSASNNDKLPKEVHAKKQKIRDDIKNKTISGELTKIKPKPSTVHQKSKVTEEAPGILEFLLTTNKEATKIEVNDDFFAVKEEISSENDDSADESGSEEGEEEEESSSEDGEDEEESGSEGGDSDEESDSEGSDSS